MIGETIDLNVVDKDGDDTIKAQVLEVHGDSEYTIEIQHGLKTRWVKAKVIEYLGNNQYVLESEDGNRYIRNLYRVNQDGQVTFNPPKRGRGISLISYGTHPVAKIKGD